MEQTIKEKERACANCAIGQVSFENRCVGRRLKTEKNNPRTAHETGNEYCLRLSRLTAVDCDTYKLAKHGE